MDTQQAGAAHSSLVNNRQGKLMKATMTKNCENCQLLSVVENVSGVEQCGQLIYHRQQLDCHLDTQLLYNLIQNVQELSRTNKLDESY